MMTAEERVAALHLRMRERRRAREQLRTRVLGAGCLGLAACLALMIKRGGAGGTAGPYSGSMMLFENAGGYVLVAVLAFMAGVAITVLLRERQGRRKPEEKEGGGTEGKPAVPGPDEKGRS